MPGVTHCSPVQQLTRGENELTSAALPCSDNDDDDDNNDDDDDDEEEEEEEEEEEGEEEEEDCDFSHL
ncbi:hypothetical protein PoB_001551800 [Plakobranchus ocellatus]|uniref:Uncharacterized protein n=1 Tax=Plakobranchus ocellatus TaxID=259542 RepID=A0AAV3Z2L0_9GAST|nr:hypothetical protein PoB_001551800 [Plakobranchus ocellatus]